MPAFRLASELRGAGVAALLAGGERSLKAQMRAADAHGAAYVAIIGERELGDATVTVRRLATGEQEAVSLANLAGWLAKA